VTACSLLRTIERILIPKPMQTRHRTQPLRRVRSGAVTECRARPALVLRGVTERDPERSTRRMARSVKRERPKVQCAMARRATVREVEQCPAASCTPTARRLTRRRQGLARSMWNSHSTCVDSCPPRGGRPSRNSGPAERSRRPGLGLLPGGPRGGVARCVSRLFMIYSGAFSLLYRVLYR